MSTSKAGETTPNSQASQLGFKTSDTIKKSMLDLVEETKSSAESNSMDEDEEYEDDSQEQEQSDDEDEQSNQIEEWLAGGQLSIF